jgi:hypothetical protein
MIGGFQHVDEQVLVMWELMVARHPEGTSLEAAATVHMLAQDLDAIEMFCAKLWQCHLQR